MFRKNTVFIATALILLVLVSIGYYLFLQRQKNIIVDTAITPPGIGKSETTDKLDNYSGVFLAGKSGSPYVTFNKAGYDKARQENKIIFLEFYANWCPICRAQAPKLVEGFNSLSDKNVVGFRVNYNDDETDDMEKQLAKDFGVTYQHTHVILKEGKVVSKSNDDLDKDSFLQLIQNAAK